MAQSDVTTEELAGRYFDENIAPGHVASGVPEDGLSFYRKNYINDVAANATAAQQIAEHYGVNSA